MTHALSIIIPVYNAFEEAGDCLRSVLEHSPEDVHILVIDDCSTEGDFGNYVPEDPVSPRLTIQRNQQNLGFVGTCNIGMKAAGRRDVILLNSDTVVTSNWISKLRRAAYSDATVGTVTPLTNNGVICSVPHFCQDNSIPGELSLGDFARLVESRSSNSYPELPSCVGFCVYIKRSVLDVVGYFDEDSFGRGYGEENDFSLRARDRGFRDILDDSTYIFHKGNCSFLGVREELSRRNSRIIQKRYPHYFDTVSKFCASNPLKGIQQKIQDAVVEQWNASRSRVLHILHNGPYISRGDPLGGTEMHVADLMEDSRAVAHWSLVAARGTLYLTAHLPGCNREYIFPHTTEMLRTLLTADHFDVLHLHHSRWFSHSQLLNILMECPNVIVSAHDYALVCPRFHMVTAAGDPCTGFECRSACGYSDAEIGERRNASLAILKHAATACCFSQSTQRTIDGVLNRDGIWQIVPHGVGHDAGAASSTAYPAAGQPFRIACIGNLTRLKGARQYKELFKKTRIGGQLIEWHVFGAIEGTLPKHVICHGRYERTELIALLRECSLHLAVFLSVAPETFSLTLSEAWLAGLPALVGPYGAPAERVGESGAGRVLKSLAISEIEAEIGAIACSPSVYDQLTTRLAEMKFSTIPEEQAYYNALYRSISKVGTSDWGAFADCIEMHAIPEARRAGLAVKTIGSFVSGGIYMLDTLGVRGYVQRTLQQLLPERVISRLKRAR